MLDCRDGPCAADYLLVLSNALVIIIGSVAFFNCIRKRGKTLAKMGGKMMHKKPEVEKKKKKNKPSAVHPL